MAGTREASLDNGPGRRRRRDSDLRRFDDQGQARLFTGPAVLVGPKGGHLVHLLTFLDLGSDSNSTRSGGLEPMPSAFFTAWRARSSMLNLSGRSSEPPNSDISVGSPRERRSIFTATSKSRLASEADRSRLPCSTSATSFSIPFTTRF